MRSLARDLGTALGTGGHVAALRRTAVGPFTLAMARTLASLPETIEQSCCLGLEETHALLDAAGIHPKPRDPVKPRAGDPIPQPVPQPPVPDAPAHD